MNIRTTLFTELGVFADFAPELPPAYRASQYVFLANIHPDLQHRVLDQVTKPKFVAADSMNLWIDIARDSLVRLLPRLDMLVINDEEAAMLTGESHLPRALRALLGMGPRRIIVKRGEYGVIMAGPEGFFIAPAWPVDDVADPTGAGDSFAGGFMGYLAAADSLDDATLRRAIAYGSAVGSFAVEKFSFDRFLSLTRAEIDERVRRFRELSRFELA
jgi:sugar/nucleoside kinase (ribokinase family)